MKRSGLLLILTALFFTFFMACDVAYAQADDPPAVEQPSNFEFNALVNLPKFSLNGDFQIPGDVVAFGMQWNKPNTVKPGIYFSTAINKEDAKTTAKVATLVHIEIANKFGIGFGYEFWQANVGILKPTDENLFFSLSYDLEFEQFL